MQSLEILTILKNYHLILCLPNEGVSWKTNSLNTLKPQKENNKKRKQEVFTNVGDIYNELYDIYKRKYNQKNK